MATLRMISNNGKGGKATLILDDRTCVWQGRKIVCLGLIGCIAKGAGMGSRFSSAVLVSVWVTSFRYVPRWIFSTLAMRLQMHSLEHRVRRIRTVETCIVLTLLLFLFCILIVLTSFFPHCFPCFIISPSSSCDTSSHRGTCRSCGLWITPWMLGLGGWCW